MPLATVHEGPFDVGMDRFYAETSQRGLSFVNPPAVQLDDSGNVQRKVAYSQDPDGNWLEFIEAF